jgi:TonB family protein
MLINGSIIGQFVGMRARARIARDNSQSGALPMPRPITSVSSLPILVFVFGLVAGCADNRHPLERPVSIPLAVPPLPDGLRDGQKLLEYYPDASKRAHEQGRVVVKLKIDASGALDLPMQIDSNLTDAAPRLQEAALKILKGWRFEVGDNYKANLTVSIVFELEPCGAVTQDPTADYRINLCLDPSPWAAFNFAEHPPSVFEEQIHKILVHGDLADIDFLEQTLGLRFRVTRPVPSPYSYGDDHAPHVLVTPTEIPKTIKVTGLGFESQVEAHDNTRKFRLQFIPVECPNIAMWAARWKISPTSSMDPHGFGSGTDFQWGGSHGIEVNASYWAGGGCQLRLSQRKEFGEPFSSHVDSDLISPTPLLRGIGAIIASGDIRDVARAERALHARFTTSGPVAFGVNYELQNIIPGVDPLSFGYSVNDTGMESSPFGAFIAQPPVPADRTARFRLVVDIYHLCMRKAQLPSELHRRGVRFRHLSKDGDDIYLIRGRNAIRIRSSIFNGCIRDVDIVQITGVKQALQTKTPKTPFTAARPPSITMPGTAQNPYTGEK